MKKIIISGANGFVGSSLSEELAKEYQVQCLVRKNANTALLSKDMNVIFIDYDNKERLLNIIKENDVFVHCAAATRAKSWEEMKKINTDFTKYLLDICNNSLNIEQFIFISSQAAAGPSKEKPKTEEDFCNPVSWYGKSKLLAENIIKKNAKMNYTIIRPSSVYGPKDKDFFQYFKLMKKHIAIQIGTKESNIAMIYIKELIKILKLSLLNPKSYNQIFFAAEKNYKISEFIIALEKAMNIKSIKLKIPTIIPDAVAIMAELIFYFSKNTPLLNKEKVKEFKINNWTVSNKKAIELLNYQPDTNLEKHLKETYEWYKNNGWL